MICLHLREVLKASSSSVVPAVLFDEVLLILVLQLQIWAASLCDLLFRRAIVSDVRILTERKLLNVEFLLSLPVSFSRICCFGCLYFFFSFLN